MTDTTTTDTVEWAPPAPRTVTDISRDLHGVDDRLRNIEKPLSTPRNRLAGAISTSDDAAYITAARAEFLPALEAAEADAIAAYDAEIARLQADEHLLSGSGFTPNLSAAEELRLPVSLAVAKTQLETLDAGDLEQAVRSALLHNDKPTLAAFVSLAGIIAQRKLPESFQLRAAISDARRAVEDPAARRIGEELKAAIAKARDRRYAIVEAANQERPGSQGSYLERYQFGQQPIGGSPPQEARGVDWHALRRRTGRAA